MKLTFFHILFALLILGSCTKVTTSKLVGKWELKESVVLEEYYYESDSSLNYTKEVRLENMSRRTIEKNYLGITTLDTTESWPFSLKYTILRDGSFSKTSLSIYPGTNLLLTNNAKGSWSFLGEDKIKNIKKNQNVFLIVSESFWRREAIEIDTIKTIFEGTILNGGDFPLPFHESDIWRIQSINKVEMKHYWESDLIPNNDINGIPYTGHSTYSTIFLKK